jgi:hypothetical protein
VKEAGLAEVEVVAAVVDIVVDIEEGIVQVADTAEAVDTLVVEDIEGEVQGLLS